MGKIQDFQVVLAGSASVYRPGQVVSGKVKFTLTSPLTVQKVTIVAKGEAHAEWSETQGSGENQKTVTYSQTETLFEFTFVPYEGGELRGGSHCYPFSCMLPPQLPTSLEGARRSYIRHFIEATIVNPSNSSFKSNARAVFTVLGVLDLNTIPDVLVPSRGTETKYLCCLCCRSGPIEIEIQLDRMGYVPGEWISINATITNSSKSGIKKTSARLVQVLTLYAQGRTHVENKSIAMVEGEGCLSRSTMQWSARRLAIPPVAPTDNVHCNLIKVEYRVELIAHLRKCPINAKAWAPVVIGTISLNNAGS